MPGTCRRKLLVLDGQGVVINAPIRQFLAEFADRNALRFADVERRWESHVREKAWRGDIDDATIWHELAGREVDARLTRKCLDANYSPGPAASSMASWSRKASIWLLSNHRSHWLIPRLESFGVRREFDQILISDRTGFLKPEAQAFEPVLRARQSNQDLLFVDDLPHNVRAAEALGIHSVLAATSTSWVREITEWLDNGNDDCLDSTAAVTRSL